MFTISLRNVSEHDLTVMLGEKCGVGSRGWKRVGIVHYTLININGAQIGFDDFGLPCSGMFGVLMQDLRPGESYSYDFDVHNTVVSENEMFFHLLNSGRELLRIQASADGQKAIDEWKGTGVDPIKIAKYPIWKGRALSESVPLAPLHAAQPHSRP